MTYRLNACLLSGLFEKSFGINNFATDYTHLLSGLNFLFQTINTEEVYYMTEPEYYEIIRLFRKLTHFFDDFNYFINESVRTRTEYDCKQSVDRRLRDFIRRVESMKIPQQIQDTIAGFLKMQRAKAAQKFDEFERFRLIHQLNSTGNKFPELRLGQLISNSLPEGTDIFYVTDTKLLQLLKDFEANNG